MTEHERRPERFDEEINVRGLTLFGLALVVVTVLAFVLMVYLNRGLIAELRSQDPAPPALEEARERRLPPGPRLQAHPTEDLERLRQREQRRLESYAVVDPERGIARVPIERAIELYLEQRRQQSTETPPVPPSEETP